MTLAEITTIVIAIGSLSGIILYLLNRKLAEKSTTTSINKTNKEIEQIEQDVESKHALQVKQWLEDLQEIQEKHEHEIEKRDEMYVTLRQEKDALTIESLAYKWKLEQCGRAHRRLFTDIHIPYWECSEDGKLVYANGAWLKLFGLTKDEAMGEGWLKSVTPEDRDRILVEWYSKVVDETDGDIDFSIQNPVTKEIKELMAVYTVKFGADSHIYKIIGITIAKDSSLLTKI